MFKDAGGAYGRSITIVREGDALALHDIAASATSRVAEAAEAMPFDQVVADGRQRLRWLTSLPPAERDFRLRQRGLVRKHTAGVVLWTARGSVLPSDGTVDTVYADLAVAAPGLGALMERVITFHLAAPDSGLVDAAPQSRAAGLCRSYLAGLAVGQALTDIARAAGQEAPRRTSAETRIAPGISVHLISDRRAIRLSPRRHGNWVALDQSRNPVPSDLGRWTGQAWEAWRYPWGGAFRPPWRRCVDRILSIAFASMKSGAGDRAGIRAPVRGALDRLRTIRIQAFNTRSRLPLATPIMSGKDCPCRSVVPQDSGRV